MSGGYKVISSAVSIRTCVPNLVAVRRSCKKGGGGGYRHTGYETFTSMSGTTVNNVSNVGGDPVTQLIVNVYQIIKL